MIGDRASDVTGARECGLPCIGVDFCGYAEPHELENAGAEAILHTVGELEDYLLGRR
jgi:phosphoglycolate phosphatase